MISKLAEELRSEVIELHRKMTPQQRLEAYIAHCESVIKIYLAGAIGRNPAVPEKIHGRHRLRSPR